MRRLVVVLLIGLSVVGFLKALVTAEDAQRARMEHAATAVGHPFVIPNDPRIADPTLVYPALRDAAVAGGVNIFRTSVGFGRKNAPQITQYALLTTRTGFFDAFSLKSGRVPTPPETAASHVFLATGSAGGTDQIGTIRDLGGGDDLAVRGLRSAFDSLPAAGNYEVEAPTQESATEFLTVLAHELNRQAHITASPLKAADLQGEDAPFSGIQNNYGSLLTAVTYLIVILGAILLAYRQLYQAKRSAVMKLSGFSTLRMWFALSGRLILVTMGASAVALVALAAFVPDATPSFLLDVCRSLLAFAVVMTATSLITCAYIVRIKVSDSIKNRKDTRAVFVLNTALKATCAVLLVVTGAGLWVQYSQAASARTKLGSWESTRDFGMFFPSSVGNDLVESQTGQAGPTVAEVYGLYPVLNGMGSVYVDASSFEPQALAQPAEPGTFRSMKVNRNYLERFPLKDVEGRRVQVSDSTSDWIVLVPVSHRTEAAGITNYFQQIRTGSPHSSGIAGAEQAVFDHPAPPGVAHQKVRIVWIADQSVFSFDPLVDPSGGNRIASPIIQVMTAANSVGLDRANMITGDANTALKVKLTGSDPVGTMKVLDPELRRLKLADNLRHLVTMNEYVAGQLESLRQGIRSVVIAAVALSVGMLALLVQSLTVTFERFARKVVVRRLFGMSFPQAYREFLTLFALLWAAQIIVAMIANAAGASPFSTATSSGAAPGPVVGSIAAGVLMAELAISAGMLLWIEKRRTVEVLKGEF
jgi:hypothetical protein